MRISVRGKAPTELAPIRASIRAAVRLGGPGDLGAGFSLTLAFVDDGVMRELNERYRGMHRTTDVLSFGQTLPRRAKGPRALAAMTREPDGSLDLGDIVISVPQAERQARRRKHGIGWELAFLAAHGALHLLGYDDATWRGYHEMVRVGNEALERAGVRT